MLKILLKKQLLEINRGFFYDQKKGRRRSRASSAAMIIAYILLMVGILGGMFTFLASQLCTPLVQAGMGWLYFTLCSLVAVALGVFGSVFNTYAGLYLAKDNDLLLSLPIPVRLVLAARMLGVYLMGLMYSGVVLIPAIAVYFCTVAQTAASVLGCVLLLVLITIFVLFLSCLLGWVVAKISLKLKNRSFAAVFLSLVLFGAYYFVGFKAQTWIRELVENAAVYGAAIRGRVYPLYLLGRVGEGDGFAMLVVSAVVLGLFALTCIVLARSFLRIATELHLKRLLVGGFERVFEIGRIFRNEGMDLTHNPEFTTMEAYRAFSDLEGMKALAQGVIKAANKAIGNPEVIEYQGQTIDLSGEWASRPMTDIVSDVLGKQVTIDTPVEELAAAAREKGLEIKPEWTAGKIIAEIYDELGEDTIVNPTFVCDYPIEVSPLAKRFEDDPRLTHRFELVIAGHEYANAFSELNDPVDQAERFAAQMAEKAGGDDEAMEYDEDYVRALEYGMPPAGGIGIGIDRVVMLLTNQASIRDVLLFPHMKPEKGFQSGAAAAKAAEAGNAASPFVKPLKPTLDYSKIAVEPLFEEFVDFDTFSKSDFRAVKVKACEAVKKSKKLLNFTLDDGTGTDRTILSGNHEYYEPEDLVGKTLLAITNLPPRKMMGIPSCGMLISAIHEEEGEERLNLIQLDASIPAGAKMY